MSDLLTVGNFAGLVVEKPQQRIPTFNALVYGESSIGKTTLAAGADAVPEMRSVLFVDIEKGDLSIRKTPFKPDVVRLTSWQELQDVYHALYAGGHGYRTAIIDSLDEVVDINLKDIMGETAGTEDATPEWQHWNMNQVRILRLLRNFRDLPMNVIFTSLVREDLDKKTGITKLLPNLPGKLGAKVPAIFDNVFYYFMKEVTVERDGQRVKETPRILLTTKTPNTVAKNRGSDNLPSTIVIPPVGQGFIPMKLIYDAVIGNENETTGGNQ